MQNSRTVAYFSEEQIRALVRYDALIDAMERALADFSSGKVLNPVRSIVTVEENRRYLGVMPAVASQTMGVKVVSFYPGNEGSDVPTHMAMIVLLRTQTGEPLAAMDGRLLTEMRTAAVSAAVTRRIAPRRCRVLALLGSGVQASAHLEALRVVRDFEEVRVWSRTPEHARSFAAEHGVLATDAESAVRDADVVVVATSAAQPVLRGAWLKDGAHVNAVGANRPTWRELDDDAMRNTVIVDSHAAAMKESGDVILSGAQVYAEAGEIFAGRLPAPTGSTTIFKSLGLAIEDVAAAQLVYEAAQAG